MDTSSEIIFDHSSEEEAGKGNSAGDQAVPSQDSLFRKETGSGHVSPTTPPPMPERWELKSIPKAYTLGYEHISYGDEDDPLTASPIVTNEYFRETPPIPISISSVSNKQELRSPRAEDALTMERSVPPRPTSNPPSPPVDAIDASDASDASTASTASNESSMSDGSIDELIGLAPQKPGSEASDGSLLQKMGRSITKVKGQTSTVWSRIVRRSSEMSDDFLGLQSAASPVRQDFVVDVDLVPPAGEEETNEDVMAIFGLGEAVEEGDSDEGEKATRRNFGSLKNNFDLLLRVLAVPRLVNPQELSMLYTTVPTEKARITKTVLAFIEEGRDREFYSIIHRSGIALPSEELRVRTVKQRDGTKFEVKRIGQLTFTVPKVFVFRDTFFFILGKRQSKLNFLNKWAGVYVQLTERQLRIYQSLADVEAENTVQRINLHALMCVSTIMKKSYKNEMMYYVKIFENDILNHRVIEDAPLKYRRDLANLMVLKVGSKEELYVQMFAYQLNLRLKAIQNMERAPL